MNEECLICGLPLQYLESEREMECMICHKKELTSACCEGGHYVCSDCHMSGVDQLLKLCLNETSKNPYEILEKLMAMDFCHMHGPEHHVLVGASLITAYHNAGGRVDLAKALGEMQARGKKVPGGICGLWGDCGSAVSSGIFVSIVTGATPLTEESWGLANRMTAQSLNVISEIGGPRCCKRNGYLAVTEGVKFAKERLGVEMELSDIRCTRSSKNNQCIGKRCPFFTENQD